MHAHSKFKCTASIIITVLSSSISFHQIHYHNPEELKDQHDSSGLRMYYTPHMRKYDTQVMSVMQMYLEIPPGLPSTIAPVQCTEQCMAGEKGLQESIYVIMATTHMHFLGMGIDCL